MATYYSHYQKQEYSVYNTVNELPFVNNNPLINELQVHSCYTSSVSQVHVAMGAPQTRAATSTYTYYSVVQQSQTNTIIDVTPGMYNYSTSNVYSNPDGEVTPDLHKNATPNVYNSITTDLYTNVTTGADISPEVPLPEQMALAVVNENERNPAEIYSRLPRGLFPPADKMNMDPNILIDAFCKIPDVSEHVSWISDIEFGVHTVNRPIAVYDIKLNSVQCQNDRTKVYPEFEKCDEDFKKVILRHYDCVMAVWYKSYISLNPDKSVDDFQAWLSLPMQRFGMNWPNV